MIPKTEKHILELEAQFFVQYKKGLILALHRTFDITSPHTIPSSSAPLLANLSPAATESLLDCSPALNSPALSQRCAGMWSECTVEVTRRG